MVLQELLVALGAFSGRCLWPFGVEDRDLDGYHATVARMVVGTACQPGCGWTWPWV